MKLIWKLAIPQISIVIILGLISFLAINATFEDIEEQYVSDILDSYFRFVMQEVDVGSQRATAETSLFVHLPVVIEAYEIAHSGDINDPYSPQAQQARELLRSALAPMLDSYFEQTGNRLQLHFHLSNGFSLARMWRDKQAFIDGEWVDISDDLSSFRPIVMEVNRTGEGAMGIEMGAGGFAIRGVLPIRTNDGTHLGSVETLYAFDPILDAINEDDKISASLYADIRILDYASDLRDPDKYPTKWGLVRIYGGLGDELESLLTEELMSSGRHGVYYEFLSNKALAVYPIVDFMGEQIGIITFAIDTTTTVLIARTAQIIMVIVLTFMAATPTLTLLVLLRRLVTKPLNKVKTIIQDIAEDRSDLSMQIQSEQRDEIGELIKWFNILTAKLVVILNERLQMLDTIREDSEKYEKMAHRYVSILDSIPFPISVQDTEMNWTFINTTLEKLIGKTRDEVVGIPCRNWNVSICNTENCAIECAKRDQRQTYFVHEDASYQVDVTILKDLQGKITGYLEVIQDITLLEQITRQQAEAEAASHAKSEFLAKMSHEIRTPMNAILGITEIQLSSGSLSKDTEEALGKIYESGNLLMGIINDILDLSKIEADKLEIIPVNYDIPSLINDTVQLLRLRYESMPIEFTVELDENTPHSLFGDELRIKQVLTNILSNAYKYTEEGRIDFSIFAEDINNAEHKDERDVDNSQSGNDVTLIFRVSDTGQGMTEEQVEQLFDEYTRFNLAANRTTVGTGLGMSITKNLVDLMGGEILVESEVNKGSVFTVRLPQKRVGGDICGAELADKLRNARFQSTTITKKANFVREFMPYGSVLVVDDVESNIYVVKGMLLPYGLQVDTASSGFDAIDKIESGNVYDVIFMDHMMPKMDGIETTKIIRGRGYTNAIVALTANALVGQADVFMANGFDSYISKPIDSRELNLVLNEFIRNKKPAAVVEAARREHSEKGMNQTAGSSESEVKLSELKKYVALDIGKAINILEDICTKVNSLSEADMELYAITVHGMKSSLLNIGESDLSAKAAGLEIAGKDKAAGIIAEETPAFIDALRIMAERLRMPKRNGAKEVTDADSAYLREKLTIIKQSCEAYNSNTARKAINDLLQKVWPDEVSKSLDDISEFLLHSDFEKAAETANKSLNISYIPFEQ